MSSAQYLSGTTFESDSFPHSDSNSNNMNLDNIFNHNDYLNNFFDMIPQELIDGIPTNDSNEIGNQEKICPLFKEEVDEESLIQKKRWREIEKAANSDFQPVFIPSQNGACNLENAIEIKKNLVSQSLSLEGPMKNNKRKKYNEEEVMAFIKLNKTGENKDGLVKFSKDKIRFEQIRKSYKVTKNEKVSTIIPNSTLLFEEEISEEWNNSIEFILDKYENEYLQFPPLIQMADHYANQSKANNHGILINIGTTLKIGKFFYEFLCYLPYAANKSAHFKEQIKFVADESNIINLDRVKKHEELVENSEFSNEDVCKFCLSGNTSDNPLISICKCCGSSKYYHFECIKKWIDSKKLQEKYKNSWSFYWNKMRCESCKADYPFFVRMNGRIEPLFTINFPESGSIILLKSVFPNKKDFFAIHMMMFKSSTKLLTIGNCLDNSCVIKDYSIDEFHCFISIDGGNLYFYDNYSDFGSGIVVKNSLKLDLDKSYKFEQKGNIYSVILSKNKGLISKETKKLVKKFEPDFKITHHSFSLK